MIASLGMYDRPETAAAHDRLWVLVRDALRARGIAAPDALSRGEAAFWPAWTAPDLVLSQTCGFPYRARLYGQVTLIGAPDHRLPGCAPGQYCSVFVVRKDDPRQGIEDFADARFAYNEPMSQSGWAAPQTHAQGLGFRFSRVWQSGAHRLSAQAVATGAADIAALDAVSYALCRRYDPFMSALREIGRTAPTPALPYVSAPGADGSGIFEALRQAVASLSAEDADTLLLYGVTRIAAESYLRVPTPAPPDQIAQAE